LNKKYTLYKLLPRYIPYPARKACH